MDTVPPMRDAQGNLNNGECVELVASTSEPKFFPYSLSVSPSDSLTLQSGGTVQNELEISGNDDALYINDVNEVACTLEPCNKRISRNGRRCDRAIGP